VLVILVVFVIGFAAAAVSRVGFAWVQPESFIAEEIAKDPTSPIAVTHEIARKNGTRPGTFNPIFAALALLAAIVMVTDPRSQPVLAAINYGMTTFVMVSVALARIPAFAQSLPSAPETAAAALLTVLAGPAEGASRSGRRRWVQRAPGRRSHASVTGGPESGRCAPRRRQLPSRGCREGPGGAEPVPPSGSAPGSDREAAALLRATLSEAGGLTMTYLHHTDPRPHHPRRAARRRGVAGGEIYRIGVLVAWPAPADTSLDRVFREGSTSSGG
jgi:hypothetical protein